jgi:hypothetical protein
MALMTLLRLPTEAELELHDIGVEGFYEEFHANTVAPFTAKVEIKGDTVNLNDYEIPKSEWFTVIKD